MKWTRNLSNLRNLLAGLYWQADDIYRILLEIGLNPAFVSFSNRAINTWQSVLEQALHHGKLQNLISLVRQEKPAIQSLALAEQNLLLSIETPTISDDEWHGPQDAVQLEKIMGQASTLRPVSFLQRGLDVSQSVVRVLLRDGSSGTGFLTCGNLLITSHHVIPSTVLAEEAVVEFNYQKTLDGRDAPVEVYRLSPQDGFVTSLSEEKGGDDWTAVRVKGNPSDKWGALDLSRVHPKVKDEAVIIQHPGGGQKQIALSHNIIVFASERRLQYLTDTIEGSSGSPVFNMEWQVLGVHHAGGWIRDPNSKQAVYRNAGVNINVVIDRLLAAGLQ